MNTQIMMIDINKRYIVQSYDNKIFIIEFAESQDVLPEEEYADMSEYECYILDNDFEVETRAIYYYSNDDSKQYLKYREDPIDPTRTTVCIKNMVAIKPGMSVKNMLKEIENQKEPDSNLSMGDIC